MKRRVFWGMTILLILMLAGSIGGIAMCRPQRSVRTGEERYGQLEEAYVNEVKSLLEEAGLSSAGVTLTYEREGDGSRTYTLLIHHRGFSCLGQEEQEKLLQAMEACFFKQEHSSAAQELTCRIE